MQKKINCSFLLVSSCLSNEVLGSPGKRVRAEDSLKVLHQGLYAFAEDPVRHVQVEGCVGVLAQQLSQLNEGASAVTNVIHNKQWHTLRDMALNHW